MFMSCLVLLKRLIFHIYAPQKQEQEQFELNCNLTQIGILDRVHCAPGLCHLLGSTVPVGLLFSASYPGPLLLLFFLFGQQSIVESHPCKQEEAGDDEEDPTALVSVLVIMIDIFVLSCEDKECNIA